MHLPVDQLYGPLASQHHYHDAMIRIMNKTVRTEDGQAVGSVDSDHAESIIVLASGFREYEVPKSRIKSIEGPVLYLDFYPRELEQYRVA